MEGGRCPLWSASIPPLVSGRQCHRCPSKGSARPPVPSPGGSSFVADDRACRLCARPSASTQRLKPGRWSRRCRRAALARRGVLPKAGSTSLAVTALGSPSAPWRLSIPAPEIGHRWRQWHKGAKALPPPVTLSPATEACGRDGHGSGRALAAWRAPHLRMLCRAAELSEVRAVATRGGRRCPASNPQRALGARRSEARRAAARRAAACHQRWRGLSFRIGSRLPAFCIVGQSV